MTINELYAEYRKCGDEKLLLELVKQSQRYCLYLYWKKKAFRGVPKERALEIAEEKALFCNKRCFREEVGCFKRCLVAYFTWQMLDTLKEVINDQSVIHADRIKAELGIDESRIPDDEAISSALVKASSGTESWKHEELERWLDIQSCLRDVGSLEAEVFVLCFQYSLDKVAEITGKPKRQVIAAKHRAKKHLLEALGSPEKDFVPTT